MKDKPTLKNYITRLEVDKELIAKHPEAKDLLEKRIRETEEAILEIVTSERFKELLNHFNV